MFGIVYSFDPVTGIGWIDSAGMKAERVLFVVDPTLNLGFVPGETVSYSEGKRAVSVAKDTQSFGNQILIEPDGKVIR